MEEHATRTQAKPAWISSIEVDNLFGEFTYRVSTDTSSRNLLIIYGDNGSGKTTILRLIYNILSPSSTKGHRTYIASVPFRRISIGFNDGTSVEIARKPDVLIGPYGYLIRKKDKIVFQAHVEVSPDGRAVVKEAIPLLQKLRSLGLSYYLLSDDRSLHVSRTIDGPRHVMRPSAIGKDRAAELPKADGLLLEALERLASWLKFKIIRAARAGEESFNELYLKVLNRVSAESAENSVLDIKGVLQKLVALEKRNEEFEPLGLSARLDLEPILEALYNAPDSRKELMVQIGRLYLESVTARLDQLQDVRDLMASIETALNSFFYRKSVQIGPDGLAIVSSNSKELRPEFLSSGEKHLLILICNVVVAKDERSIFIVDEPELSLNVKWQRRLISTLLEFSKGGNNQFIFATHSLEFLAQSQEHVVKLSPFEK